MDTMVVNCFLMDQRLVVLSAQVVLKGLMLCFVEAVCLVTVDCQHYHYCFEFLASLLKKVGNDFFCLKFLILISCQKFINVYGCHHLVLE